MNRRHFLIMLLGCFVPISVGTVTFLFKIPVNPVMYFGITVFCLLVFFVLMKWMGYDRDTESPAVPVYAEVKKNKK